jgi:hypothetical protein
MSAANDLRTLPNSVRTFAISAIGVRESTLLRSGSNGSRRRDLA